MIQTCRSVVFGMEGVANLHVSNPVMYEDFAHVILLQPFHSQAAIRLDLRGSITFARGAVRSDNSFLATSASGGVTSTRIIFDPGSSSRTSSLGSNDRLPLEIICSSGIFCVRGFTSHVFAGKISATSPRAGTIVCARTLFLSCVGKLFF